MFYKGCAKVDKTRKNIICRHTEGAKMYSVNGRTDYYRGDDYRAT
jgi:hypothetical protein